jgi:hypothetical protein
MRSTTLAGTFALAALLAVPAGAGARSADFVATPNPGVVGSAVRFDGSTSNGITIQIGCPSGIHWYSWNFGDGTGGSGKVVNHVYAREGKYNVTLTVGVDAQWCSTDSTTKQQTIWGIPTKGTTHTFSTSMSGPEQSETTAGDPDGTGFATITVKPAQSQVCFSISHSNIQPTQAGHVHQGARRANGPPVVNLYSHLGTNGSISGCTSADTVTINGIITNPRNYYVQLHNQPYPLGVIRGQLGD